MTEPTLDQLLAHAADRARARPFFLAGALARYQESERLDAAGLAAYLGCAPVALDRLGLCRRPADADPAAFRRDIDALARHFALDGSRLAALLRHVAALDALAGAAASEAADPTGQLLAARDREDGDEA